MSSIILNQGNPMSMKRTDLEKNRGLKINGKLGAAGIPSRFAAGAASVVDKREQRRLDRASGQIPFACKLPAELVKQLQERGAAHEGGINVFMAELITSALAEAK
jgi:hypothetical protein